MVATVDERGRILIPKAMRERYGLHPGTPVALDEHEGGIEIRVEQDAVEALRRVRGAINKRTRTGPPLDPLDVKRIWEPRV